MCHSAVGVRSWFWCGAPIKMGCGELAKIEI
jgi:hypothetical protein